MKKRDFKDIVKFLRQYFSLKYETKKTFNNGFFSSELGVAAGTFSAWKTRNSIPHEVLLDYCYSEGIDPLKLFYGVPFKPVKKV